MTDLSRLCDAFLKERYHDTFDRGDLEAHAAIAAEIRRRDPLDRRSVPLEPAK